MTAASSRLLPLALAILLLAPAGAAERREQGQLVFEDVPVIPAALVERMRQYTETRAAGLRDWTPDGGLLIGTRFGNTAQLHQVGAPLGMRSQLTFFEEPVSGGDYPPAGKQNGFLFMKDIGGNEQNQIFWFDTANGEYRLLTDGESRNTTPIWSNDGSHFAFTSNARNGKDMDIWLGTRDDKTERLLDVEGAWYMLDWSPDNKSLLALKYVSINESYLYEVSVADGSMKQLNPQDENIAYNGALYAPDGNIYLLSDQDSEFLRLRKLEKKTGAQTVLTADLDWDVTSFDISPDGRYLAYVTNEDGVERLRVRDVKRNREARVDKLPIGVMSSPKFDPQGKRIAISVSAADAPTDIYVYELASERITRWTKSEVGGLNPDKFISPELVRYPTFDEANGARREIPAFVYKPRGKGPHPVIVYIHGGPESQYQPYFSSTFQYLLNELNVAVVAPNVRGSAGYGKSWLLLDNGFKREESVKDIGALLDWLKTQPDLDANRVIVYGGSYGGYMVLASMTHFSERLLGGIDVVGISNFVTFLKNTQDYRRDLRRAEYGDERDQEMHAFLQEISPNNNAEKIGKPLLVIQGANDPRVPLSEAEQMVATIRKNNGEVWYLMAKDEGHGFRKKENSEAYLATVSLFIESLLKRSQ